jgi:hypothetical protein
MDAVHNRVATATGFFLLGIEIEKNKLFINNKKERALWKL